MWVGALHIIQLKLALVGYLRNHPGTGTLKQLIKQAQRVEAPC